MPKLSILRRRRWEGLLFFDRTENQLKNYPLGVPDLISYALGSPDRFFFIPWGPENPSLAALGALEASGELRTLSNISRPGPRGPHLPGLGPLAQGQLGPVTRRPTGPRPLWPTTPIEPKNKKIYLNLIHHEQHFMRYKILGSKSDLY